MDLVPFSALYDYIIPYVPGVEKPIVDSQIRKATREFMKRTTLFRETFSFPTIPGTSTYQLVPTFGQVASVIQAWIDTDMHDLKPAVEHKRPPVGARKPEAWFTTIPDMLTLYAQPDAVYTITVNAVVTLKIIDTELPRALALHHAEALSAGVLALLYSMPGKPWTQSDAAREAGRIYAGAINTIRASLRDGGQPNQSTFIGAAKFGA